VRERKKGRDTIDHTPIAQLKKTNKQTTQQHSHDSGQEGTRKSHTAYEERERERTTYRLGHVNDRGDTLGGLGLGLGALLLGDEGPQLVEVDGRAMVHLLSLVEVTHTNLTKVTRMELVEQDTVMMLTTGVTASRRMLAVLANTTVA
jgi:hypothetical protein